jgi:tetratricopeptide (TPR) repeat protein
MPGAGHLVHMPAHIYLRLGMYDRAAETNVHAAATDEGYIADQSPDGIYPVGYYSHNLHFLGFAAAMEGRSAEAIDASRRLVENVTFDVARKLPPLELWTSVPYWTLARFGHWQEILEEPAPPSDLRFTTAQWHFARGLALAATKRLEDAKVEVDSLQAVLRATPPDAPIGFHHKAKDLLQISTDVLAADIADKSGRTDEAIKLYQDAVRAQDALLYDEPPPFYYPVRQSLGAALLEAGRAKEAEAVYREDLKLFPKNGWSLYGLAQSLKAQGKAGEAAAADKEFKEAWARADVKLTASAF